jgi:hypothetical protein
MTPRAAAAGAVLGCLACSQGEALSNAGLDQPIQIEAAQFISGELPGRAVDASSAGDAGAGPRVVEVTIANRVIQPRQSGAIISGHSTTDSQAVAVRFAGLGSGYFVAPVGAPDPSDNGQLTWQLVADFGDEIAPGFHDLLFSSVDATGASGPQFALPVCVDTPAPDNLNACAPSRAPPTAVVSLSWNTPVDLDLVVQTPSGTIIGGKLVAASAPDGGGPAPGTGVLDHDSNRDCAIDGIQREDIVWQSTPQSGVYQVRADLFSACHQPAVTFTASLWLARTQSDGTKRLVEQPTPIATGVLTAAQANGGAAPGLYLGSFELR